MENGIRKMREYKRPNKYMTLDERFWFCVVRKSNDECWEWTGTKTNRGYGNIEIDGHAVGAHRLSYIIHFGEIPPNMDICHHCDNRGCVNPNHLFVGTNMDNVQDKIRKGRQPHGMNIKLSKLCDDDIPKIRSLYATGKYSQREIAKMFGLKTHVSICRIINGTGWKHIIGQNG